LKADGRIEAGELLLERRLGDGETGGTRSFMKVVLIARAGGEKPITSPDARQDFDNVMDGASPEGMGHEKPPSLGNERAEAGVCSALVPRFPRQNGGTEQERNPEGGVKLMKAQAGFWSSLALSHSCMPLLLP
jgi:hypothetical protein